MHKYDSYSDDELIGLLKQDDLQAFSAIHSRYYGVMYSHAYKRLPEREEIRDMLQDLFTELWNKRGNITFKVNLQAYLYTAVRNRILNIFKHQHVKTAYVASFEKFMEQHTPMADEELRLKELIALVEAEVNSLPPQMRLIFNMSRKANLSHQEIADELNISPLTVKKQVNNSLKILRLKLGHHFFLLFF